MEHHQQQQPLPPASDDVFLCTTPVYFKAVPGDYLTAIEVSEDVPVTQEKGERVLRYKQVSRWCDHRGVRAFRGTGVSWVLSMKGCT